MSSEILNPYGEEIKVLTDGTFYRVVGKNEETYISDDLEGVIAAFIEDVYEDGQIFTSIRNNTNYMAKLSAKLTDENNGTRTYTVAKHVAYLV